MSSLPRRFAAALALLAAAVLTQAALPAASGAETAAAGDGADVRCYSATARKRKTSLGVHQWTVRQTAEWCAVPRGARWRIVSVNRSARVRTGTNWRLISRSGGVNRDGARAIAESRFHFRLRYPYYEQNCYPRLVLELWPSGRFERTVRVGC